MGNRGGIAPEGHDNLELDIRTYKRKIYFQVCHVVCFKKRRRKEIKRKKALQHIQASSGFHEL